MILGDSDEERCSRYQCQKDINSKGIAVLRVWVSGNAQLRREKKGKDSKTAASEDSLVVRPSPLLGEFSAQVRLHIVRSEGCRRVPSARNAA